jgi:hypothetical protein
LVMRGVDFWRVVGSVEVVHRDVQNPHSIEVDQKMSKRPPLVIRFEKDTIPSNATEFCEPLCGWDVHKSCLGA